VQTYNANKDKLTIIAVNWNENVPEVQDFVKQFKIGFPVVIDNTGDLISQFRVQLHPHSVFINQEGIITNIIPGLVEEQLLKDFVTKSI
jgi:thioredoxin-related protein